MAEQTVLVILIAILTVSWAAIAVMAVLIGLRLLRIFDEAERLVRRLRIAGEAAAADVQELREKIRKEGSKVSTLVEYALGFASRTLFRRRKK